MSDEANASAATVRRVAASYTRHFANPGIGFLHGGGLRLDGGGTRRYFALWLVVLTASVATHLVALGDRAMNHDESIHALLSWELAENGNYVHDPAYHGPLLYHLNAVVYSLFGDSDSSARWAPALAGILLLVAIHALRRDLGETGALVAGVLAALSPTLLFYGRFLLSDISMALFATLWMLGVLRYLANRQARWLWLSTLAMALSFAAKETAFITGLSLGSFLILVALARRRRGAEPWVQGAAGELALTMLLIVLPFASPLAHFIVGWDPLDYDGPEAWRRGRLVISALVVTSAALAWAAFGRRRAHGSHGLNFVRWASLFGAFWSLQILLFTSGFKNAPRGVLSGVLGSLGYWLGQHEVARGSHPGSYYLILLTLYEYLPLLLSALAGVALMQHATRERSGAAAGAKAQPIAPWLLLWWALSGGVAYSIAGEKMPWLTVPVVLPIVLLGGWWLGRVIDRVDWKPWRTEGWRRLWLPAVAPWILFHSLSRLLGSAPQEGRGLEAIAQTNRYLFSLGAAAAMLVLSVIWLRRRQSESLADARRVFGLGCVLALALFTAQTSWRLSFRDAELATELMVYAHATPDIKRALAEVDDLRRRVHWTDFGGEIPIAYDGESAWPFNWYLRHHRQKLYFGDAPPANLSAYPIVLAGTSSEDALWPLLGGDYARRDLNLIWWPIERLTRLGFADVVRVFSDPEARRAAWRYAATRDLPERAEPRWPNRREFRLYVRRDLLEQSWELHPVRAADDSSQPSSAPLEETRVEPRGFHDREFAGRRLALPTQVVVLADGTRAVADAGNDRVVLFATNGSFVGAIEGDLEEPWGVAGLPDGRLAIADTWHGRIRFYASNGLHQRSFGAPLVDGIPPLPTDGLYGPRGMIYHPPSDRLLISDTGHHRILALDVPRDDREFALPLAVSVPLQEPVGLAVDPVDGSVLIADTWNRRIQRLGRNLEPVAAWPVPGWAGRDPYNKPYLAIDGRGLVYATDPNAARVLVFSRDGNPLGAMVAVGWRGALRAIPLGIAVDLARQELLVSDAASGRIWILPLWSGPV